MLSKLAVKRMKHDYKTDRKWEMAAQHSDRKGQVLL